MDHALVFDFPDSATGRSVRRVFGRPAELLVARTAAEVLPALREIERAAARGLWAAGCLTYEAAPAFDRALEVRPDGRMPPLWFALYDSPPEVRDSPAPPPPAPAPALDWRPDTSRERFDDAVAAIHEAIAEGRTYQVNYTTRLHARFHGEPPTLYEELRASQGRGLHAYLDMGRFVVASASPELFFRLAGGRVETRPMKGTRPRGRWPGEDEALAAELVDSAKERAENLMIVDLLRNDLGRVARTGSVRVPRLFEVERYRTVLQLTSTIAAEPRQGCGLTELLGALFPCGSVTGAPKISTMGIIAALETMPREVYCGAIGMIEPGGDCVFSVPIRTVLIDRESGEAEYGVGSGITAGSTAGAEYDELLAKAAVLRDRWPAFELLETLRLEDGRYARLERHLSRMRDSATYFDYPFGREAVERLLDELASSHPAGARRVRLMLAADGRARIESSPLEPIGGRGAASPPAVALSHEPVSSADRFLFHKTTHRSVYDRALAGHEKVLDVLLRNERGEVTEFTRGNVVLELDGRRVTPPRRCGLLAGCFRAELLQAGRIEERVVPVERLPEATRVWLVNSVREWVEVRLATSD